MAHGRRRGVANVDCPEKQSAYSTWDAAMAAVARVPDAQRAYRGSCCGFYHITRYTEAEYAQRVALGCGDDHALRDDEGCTNPAAYGIVDSTDEIEDHHDRQEELREPREGAGGPGEASQPCGGLTRLAPSPAEVARRLQASRGA